MKMIHVTFLRNMEDKEEKGGRGKLQDPVGNLKRLIMEIPSVSR